MCIVSSSSLQFKVCYLWLKAAIENHENDTSSDNEQVVKYGSQYQVQ